MFSHTHTASWTTLSPTPATRRVVKLSCHRTRSAGRMVMPLFPTFLLDILNCPIYKLDIYISSVSYAHRLSARGTYVAIVRTMVITLNWFRCFYHIIGTIRLRRMIRWPILLDIAPGLDLLGPVMQRFDNICETFEPTGDGMADRCFIRFVSLFQLRAPCHNWGLLFSVSCLSSSSFDATSHFESTAQDVLKLYQAVTGEELDMNINADSVQE